MDAFSLHVMALNAAVLPDEDQVAHLNMLVSMLLPISPVCKHALVNLARSLPFRPEYKTILEEKISALKEGGTELWQDYSTMHLFMNEDMARAWSDRNLDINVVIWQLLQFSEKMGLVKPDQRTFQTLATIVLCLKNGTSWSPVEKKKLFDQVKVEFTRSRPQRIPGQLLIANLPESPQKLYQLVPMMWWTEVYGKPFGDIHWINYEGQIFDRIAKTVAMRNTRTDVRDAARAASLDLNSMIMNSIQQRFPSGSGLARSISFESDPNITLIRRPANALNNALAAVLAAGAGAGAFPALQDEALDRAGPGSPFGGPAGAQASAQAGHGAPAGPQAPGGGPAGPGAPFGAPFGAPAIADALAGPQAPAGGGEGAGGTGAEAVVNTAAGVRNQCGRGMSLNEVAKTLGAHVAMKKPAAAEKKSAKACNEEACCSTY